MEVRMDSLNKYQKYKLQKSTKVLITQPFFELQTPDFAWKFVWIFRTNYKSKKVKKYISTHNSAIFWATDSRFCMEVHFPQSTKIKLGRGFRDFRPCSTFYNNILGKFLHLQQAKNFYIYNMIKRKSTTPKNKQKTVFGYYFWFNLMT